MALTIFENALGRDRTVKAPPNLNGRGARRVWDDSRGGYVQSGAATREKFADTAGRTLGAVQMICDALIPPSQGRYTVAFGGKTAMTERGRRRITVTPAPLFMKGLRLADVADTLTGFVVHEIGHVAISSDTDAAVEAWLESEPGYKPWLRSIMAISNVLDDHALEVWAKRRFPGVAHTFRVTTKFVAQEQGLPTTAPRKFEATASYTERFNFMVVATRYRWFARWVSDPATRTERDWWIEWAETYGDPTSAATRLAGIKAGIARLAINPANRPVEDEPEPEAEDDEAEEQDEEPEPETFDTDPDEEDGDCTPGGGNDDDDDEDGDDEEDEDEDDDDADGDDDGSDHDPLDNDDEGTGEPEDDDDDAESDEDEGDDADGEGDEDDDADGDEGDEDSDDGIDEGGYKAPRRDRTEEDEESEDEGYDPGDDGEPHDDDEEDEGDEPDDFDGSEDDADGDESDGTDEAGKDGLEGGDLGDEADDDESDESSDERPDGGSLDGDPEERGQEGEGSSNAPIYEGFDPEVIRERDKVKTVDDYVEDRKYDSHRDAELQELMEVEMRATRITDTRGFGSMKVVINL